MYRVSNVCFPCLHCLYSAGLYFDHGFDAATPMHNVSSQIVCDGPGTVLQRGLGSKLATLHVADAR